MAVKITGTGSALPEKKVTNQEISQLVDTSDEWIRERTGICARHISTRETVASLASQAGLRALENAEKSPKDVELLLVATCSPELYLPCCACQVQAAIGAENAVAFDVNAACAGFLFALHTAYAYLEAGIYRTALVAGAEVLSKITDWKDRTTCVLFGDGAGAVVLERVEAGAGILGFVQNSDGRKGHVLRCESRAVENPFMAGQPGIGQVASDQSGSGMPDAGQADSSRYVQMDGREIFQFATRQVPASIEEVLLKTGISKEEVDYYILHQANARIIEMIAKRLKLSLDKFPMNLDEVGNTSSAAIPLLLDKLNREGRLTKGMKLVLSGFGAGLTYGACVLVW